MSERVSKRVFAKREEGERNRLRRGILAENRRGYGESRVDRAKNESAEERGLKRGEGIKRKRRRKRREEEYKKKRKGERRRRSLSNNLHILLQKCTSHKVYRKS